MTLESGSLAGSSTIPIPIPIPELSGCPRLLFLQASPRHPLHTQYFNHRRYKQSPPFPSPHDFFLNLINTLPSLSNHPIVRLLISSPQGSSSLTTTACIPLQGFRSAPPLRVLRRQRLSVLHPKLTPLPLKSNLSHYSSLSRLSTVPSLLASFFSSSIGVWNLEWHFLSLPLVHFVILFFRFSSIVCQSKSRRSQSRLLVVLTFPQSSNLSRSVAEPQEAPRYLIQRLPSTIICKSYTVVAKKTTSLSLSICASEISLSTPNAFPPSTPAHFLSFESHKISLVGAAS